MSAIQWTATERNSRPRRSTLAIVAVLAAVVCGAATISAAMTRPGDDRRPVDAPPGVAVAPPSPVAAPAASQAPTVPSPAPLPPRILAGGPIAVPPPTPPAGSAGSLEPDLVLLGSWTVEYVVGPGNGNGANIAIPLDRLDGRVIRPGRDVRVLAGDRRGVTPDRLSARRDHHRSSHRPGRRAGRWDLHRVDRAVQRRRPCRAPDHRADEPRRLPGEVPARPRCGGRQGRRLPPDRWPSATTRRSRSSSAPSARRESRGSTCTGRTRSVGPSRSASPRSAVAREPMTAMSGRTRCRAASIVGSRTGATG